MAQVKLGQLGDYINELDYHVGEIMATLEELELADNTILIFASDNGGARKDHSSAGKNLDLRNDSDDVAGKSKTAKTVAREKFGHRTNGDLQGYKGSNYEGGFRVPFIVRWPGKIAAGAESNQVTTLADMLATTAGLLGKNIPESAGVDSFDLSPVLLGKSCDIRSLTRYLKRIGNDDCLRMEKDTLLQYQPDHGELVQYPNRLDINRHEFECSYCFEPGMDTDGVTVKVPTALSQSIPPETIDWLVPGLYPKKIEVLIKGLPKAYRKKLVPVKNTVDIIVSEMPRLQTALVTALGDFIYRRFGVDIPAAAWSTESLPDYLKMRISITAPDGREIRAGRDAALLRRDVNSLVKSDKFDAARKKWETKGITRWDFTDLPEFVAETGDKKTAWVAYPALETDAAANKDKSVNLRLFRRQGKALAVHRAGVATLYAIHFAKNLKLLKRQLILPADVRFKADYFGGPKKLVQEMYDRVIEELFARDIRTGKAFYDHADSATAKIFPAGRELLDKIIPVLNAYHDGRSRIYELQQANRNNRMASSYFEGLCRGLEHLVPQTFVAIYDIRRMDHLPRYIQAAAIRARRAVVDFEKDRVKSEEIIKFTDGLNQMLKELSPSVSDEKRQAIEAYFWMVEEYKVSVFAQELKTAIPVSAKRLDRKLKEIGRMI